MILVGHLIQIITIVVVITAKEMWVHSFNEIVNIMAMGINNKNQIDSKWYKILI